MPLAYTCVHLTLFNAATFYPERTPALKYFFRAMKLLWPLRGRLALYIFCTVLLAAVGSSPLALGRALVGQIQGKEQIFKDPVGEWIHPNGSGSGGARDSPR